MSGLVTGGRVLTLRLIGGSLTAVASDRSARDAVGTVVTAVTSSGSRVFRRSAGEGLASQNSGAVRITLASDETLRELRINWPSGRTSTHQPLPSETPLVICEVAP